MDLEKLNDDAIKQCIIDKHVRIESISEKKKYHRYYSQYYVTVVPQNSKTDISFIPSPYNNILTIDWFGNMSLYAQSIHL